MSVYAFDRRYLRSMRRPGFPNSSHFSLYENFAEGAVTSPRTCLPGPGTLEHNDGSAVITGGQWVGTTDADKYLQENATHSRADGMIYAMHYAVPASGSDLCFGPVSSGGSFANVRDNMRPGLRYLGSSTLNTRYGTNTAAVITDLAEGDWISTLIRTTGAIQFRNQDIIFIHATPTDATLRTAVGYTSTPAEINALRRTLASAFAPVPLLADDFTGKSDTTNIPTTNGTGMVGTGGSGLTWTESGADSVIATGAWQGSGVVNNYLTTEVSNANCYGFVRCPASGSTAGLVFNYVDDNNFWLACKISNAIRIYEVTASVITQRATAAVTVANNDEVHFCRLGSSTVRAWHYNPSTGGVTSVVYTSATANNTATKAGLMVTGTGRISKCEFYARNQPNFPLSVLAA